MFLLVNLQSVIASQAFFAWRSNLVLWVKTASSQRTFLAVTGEQGSFRKEWCLSTVEILLRNCHCEPSVLCLAKQSCTLGEDCFVTKNVPRSDGEQGSFRKEWCLSTVELLLRNCHCEPSFLCLAKQSCTLGEDCFVTKNVPRSDR